MARKAKPAAVASKAKPAAKAGTPAQLWASLADRIHLHHRKVTRAEIKAAEKALGVKLPPSYVELVTSVGAPAIAPPKRSPSKNVENLGYAVLTPPEIVKYTRLLRRAPERDQAEDDEQLESTRKYVDGAIWFQLGANAGEGFVFLLDQPTRGGEMRVGAYSHDYLYELDWKNPATGWKSFTDSTKHVVEEVYRHTEEHGLFTW